MKSLKEKEKGFIGPSRKLQVIIGLILQISYFFMLFSILSHFFTQKNDQTYIESLKIQDFNEKGNEIHNWFGIIGAYIGHFFVYDMFGFSSFFLIQPFYFIAYRLTYGKNFLGVSIKKAFSTSLLFSFWLMLFYGYINIFFDKEGVSFASLFIGKIGYALSVVSQKYLGYGTLLILFGLLPIFLVYTLKEETLSKIINKIRKLKERINKKPETTTFSKDKRAQNEEQNEGTLFFPIKEKSIYIQTEENVTENLVVSPIHEQNDLTKKREKELEVQIRENKVTEDDISKNSEERQFEKKPFLPLPRNNIELENYKFPSPELLEEYPQDSTGVTKAEIEQNKNRIVETLTNFNIGVSTIYATIGPTVTLYEIIPDAGIKISRIKSLEDDIALSLSALGIRIIAPIPGKGTIGIEVPNKTKQIVPLRSILESKKFSNSGMTLPLVVGKGIDNEPYIVDLASMPHLLIAGATGQGKSVGINVVLTSLIYKKHPSQLKLVLVDPKKVELSLYAKLEKHFLAKLPGTEDPIITETKKVVYTLNSLCTEMDLRYDLLKDAGVRNIKEYNVKFNKGVLEEFKGHRFLPYIVLVIDEFADLMMVAGKEVEMPIARLAQLARAIGIHLILATQRPSVNIITGIIKANFPARLSFKVSSKVDSRTILDVSGAEQLIGRGDLLMSINSEIVRLQCPFLDTEEVERICTFIGNQQGYETPYFLPEATSEEDGEGRGFEGGEIEDRDPLFFDAARLIVSSQQGSTSLIQRKLKLGYNRAGRLMDQLEAAAIVGPADGSKAREVYIFDISSIDAMQKEM